MNGNLKLLIVDDEPDLLKNISSLLKSQLRDLNLQIVEASNGRKALELVKSQDFDVVLMDVKMPEMDGLEALAQIKSINPKIFVVIMTAHSNLQDAVQAIREGAYDYLEKPMEPQKDRKSVV